MATQVSIWSYRGHRFAAITRCVLPGPRTSIVRLRDIGETAKQNSARNNAKCSRCLQFLCNDSDWTWFFNALTFARSLTWFFNALTFARSRGRCWKPRQEAAVFNTSLGTWQMLMHEKPFLIPIYIAKGYIFWTSGSSSYLPWCYILIRAQLFKANDIVS